MENPAVTPRPTSSAAQFQPEAAIQEYETLDSEFEYYSAILPTLVQKVKPSNHVVTWISRLSSPEMSIEKLKDLRNRYLLYLCISLSSGTLKDSIFTKPPPDTLLSINLVKRNAEIYFSTPAELDTIWIEQISEDMEMTTKLRDTAFQKCIIHKKEPCPSDPEDEQIGTVLDHHFQFFLHLANSHVGNLAQAMHRQRAAYWLQTLCCIPKSLCAEMKGIRNDYMMLLLGYIESGLLLGPFQHFPPEQLVSLKEAAEQMPDDGSAYASDSQINEMLRKLPRPECGAFAFLGISADLCQE